MRQTNTRKKNNLRSMIIVALLLLLVAVIGFGGYTLSKYVSNKTSGGTAQVAKWGYTVEADATKLFGKNYTFDTASSVVTDGTADLTVSSSSTANLVAPGTSGSMTFSVKGTAEVLAKVSIKVTDVKDIMLKYTNNGVAATDPYSPVKWTLTKKNAAGETTTLVNGLTLADVKTELAKAEHNRTYEPNSAEINDVYTLSWAWDFGAADVTTENDHLDTLLGMYAKDNALNKNGTYEVATGTSTEVKFTLEISVTQLAKNA